MMRTVAQLSLLAMLVLPAGNRAWAATEVRPVQTEVDAEADDDPVVPDDVELVPFGGSEEQDGEAEGEDEGEAEDSEAEAEASEAEAEAEAEAETEASEAETETEAESEGDGESLAGDDPPPAEPTAAQTQAYLSLLQNLAAVDGRIRKGRIVTAWLAAHPDSPYREQAEQLRDTISGVTPAPDDSQPSPPSDASANDAPAGGVRDSIAGSLAAPSPTKGPLPAPNQAVQQRYRSPGNTPPPRTDLRRAPSPSTGGTSNQSVMAGCFSLLLPGAGQLYNGEYLKGGLILGAFEVVNLLVLGRVFSDNQIVVTALVLGGIGLAAYAAIDASVIATRQREATTSATTSSATTRHERDSLAGLPPAEGAGGGAAFSLGWGTSF